MIRFFQISIVLIGISMPMNLSAQKDFSAWAGIDVRIPLSKKIDAGIQLQGRFENNISEVNQTFISPYVKYNLHKHIGLEMAYRFSNRPESGMFGSRNVHRIGFDLNFKNLLDLVSEDSKLSFDARVRYTHATDDGDLNNDNLRTRFKLGYNISKAKLKPYILTEFFYHFNDQLTYTSTEVTSVHRFNKYRIRLGMDYELKKRHELSLFYVIQPTIESPDTDFILGLGYKFKLKRMKKD